MLYNLLSGIEPSSSLLIQDSLSKSGIAILLSFIQENIKRLENDVHIICLENPPIYIEKRLSGDTNYDNLKFYDYCTDHRAWDINDDYTETIMDLANIKLQPKQLLIVDSISSLISRIGIMRTYHQLHSIINSEVRIICLVHEDFLPNSSATLKLLIHIFSTSLQVLPSTSHNYQVVSTHVKKSGKVMRSTEECTIDSKNNLTICKGAVIKADLFSVAKSNIPKEITTFKLDLGESEKVARNKLILPYLRQEGGSGGEVFYEPEDADLWDEENPDDDLDV